MRRLNDDIQACLRKMDNVTPQRGRKLPLMGPIRRQRKPFLRPTIGPVRERKSLKKTRKKARH
ncbi:MAG: hypothetical protein WC030_02405 [Candidatus Paceibacterota bacterium]